MQGGILDLESYVDVTEEKHMTVFNMKLVAFFTLIIVECFI